MGVWQFGVVEVRQSYSSAYRSIISICASLWCPPDAGVSASRRAS
jgi:hypothetical protein